VDRRGPGHEPAAGAVADERDPRGVHAQLGGLGVQPLQCREAVVEGGGERVLGSESVFHGHDRDAELPCQLRRLRMLHVDGSDGEAAPVDVEDRARRRDRRLGCVDAHDDVGRMRRPRHRAIFDPQAAHVRVGQRRLGEHVDHRPGRGEVSCLARGERVGERLQLGIVCVGHDGESVQLSISLGQLACTATEVEGSGA
jgi:hypothetical protein